MPPYYIGQPYQANNVYSAEINKLIKSALHPGAEPARDRYCRDVNNAIKTVEPKALKHTLTTVKKLGKQLKTK